MLYHEIPCPECNGYGYISNSSMTSVWCSQCTNCRGAGLIVVPMTNGEIIRTCSNEELARVYDNLSKWAIYSGGNNNRLLFQDNPEDFLLWLNKDADDVDLDSIFDFINKEDYEHPYIRLTKKTT